MKTVIIFRFSAMGDVAMTVPVIEQFLQQYSNYQVCMISRPKFQPFFENMERLIFFPADLEKKYRGFKGLFSLFNTLRKNYPDAIFVDLHSVLRTHLIGVFVKLYGLRYIRLKKPRRLLQKITRLHHKQQLQIPTVFERYAACFRKFEGEFQLINQPLKQRFTTQKKALNQYWIGIAPFAQHKGKILPIDTIVDVIDLIIKQTPTVQIFLFGGGKKEVEVLHQLAEQFPNRIANCSTMKSLSEELQLMANLDVMISMDSANMHLASLCNIRVISIWGATHPSCGFLGWRQRLEDCIANNLDCRPCSVYGNKPCFRKDYACLTNIKSQDIVERIFA